MSDWPFYERLADLYRAADISPPSRSIVRLHEVADEVAAVELLELIANETTSPAVALECATKVLAALDRYRNERDFQARPSVDPLSQLQRARDKDLVGSLRKHIANPDVARVLLTELLVGAWEAGILPLQDQGGRLGPAFGEDGQWALELVGQPTLFRRVVEAAFDSRPKVEGPLDLVRRLRDLVKTPTPRRFCGLIRDARQEGSITFSTLASALRRGARRKIFKNRDLPQHWVSELLRNPKKIAAVAGKAHELLKKSLPGQGGVPNDDLERYCGRCADAYESLTGQPIKYSKTTENSRNATPGRAYGKGLCFMWLAMRLVDASVSENEAQYRLDQLLGYTSHRA